MSIFCARFLLKYLGRIDNNVNFTFDLIHIIIDVVVLVANHMYTVNYDIYLSRNSFNPSFKTIIKFKTNSNNLHFNSYKVTTHNGNLKTFEKDNENRNLHIK
jgi:hypothetical protein